MALLASHPPSAGAAAAILHANMLLTRIAPRLVPSSPTTTTSARRTFTTKRRKPKAKVTMPAQLLPSTALQPPPYPYPAARWYKQQNHGLYGGATLQTGHNVSEKNEVKSPREWRPNIQRKRLYSDALARPIRVRVATSVLRTIDRVGGLDAYLLGGGARRVRELGVWGWRLRWAVLNAQSLRPRLEREPELRALLGIDEEAVLRPAPAVVDEIATPPPVAGCEDEAESLLQGIRDEEREARLREARRIGHMYEQPAPPGGGFMGRLRGLFRNPFRRG